MARGPDPQTGISCPAGTQSEAAAPSALRDGNPRIPQRDFRGAIWYYFVGQSGRSVVYKSVMERDSAAGRNISSSFWRGFWFRSLGYKLILSGGIITFLCFGVFTYLILEAQKEQFIQQVLQGAGQITDTIRRATRFDMLINHRDALHHIIETIGRQEGITRVRIFNKEGKITFSSDHDEAGKLVNKRADSCLACHGTEEPLDTLSSPKTFRIFEERDGRRILGVIAPVYNEPDCFTALCHAHKPEQRILGVMDIHFSLDPVDQWIAQNRNRMLWFAGLAIAAMSVFLGLFFQRFVNRPVKQLLEGTSRVAEGNLDYQIPLKSKDEIGRLAGSFNDMTRKLNEAHLEIQKWVQTLEKRVDERSRELQEAQNKLFQSEKLASLGRVAASVAHEINNPVSGILSYAKYCEKMVEGEGPVKEAQVAELRDCLEMIGREAERCGRIIQQLLEFARQRWPSYRLDVDINQVIEEALELSSQQTGLKEITIEKGFGRTPAVPADPALLQQAFLNVILNSCEAMEGRGILRIRTAWRADEKMVEIVLQDNGQGIDPEDVSKIFDPFYTTKGNKTGLGLSVVYGIVQAHHGKIDVQSAPGKGTTLVIKLPVTAASLPAVP